MKQAVDLAAGVGVAEHRRLAPQQAGATLRHWWRRRVAAALEKAPWNDADPHLAAGLTPTRTNTGTPAGEIDLYYQEPPTGQAMIGYSMLPAFRGRGPATAKSSCGSAPAM